MQLFSFCQSHPKVHVPFGLTSQWPQAGPHHIHAQWWERTWPDACAALYYIATLHWCCGNLSADPMDSYIHACACIELVVCLASVLWICACFLGMLTWYQATISAKDHAFYALPTDQLFKQHIPSEHRWSGDAKVKFHPKETAPCTMFESPSAKNLRMYKHVYKRHDMSL